MIILNEIFIYGNLASEKWFDSDVCPSDIASSLQNASGQVIIHMNSGGGDVFAGLTIANLVKQRGDVEVVIDGLCASAATLIACSAARVRMSSNALFMIHLPSAYLEGWQTESDLNSVQKSLCAIKNSIVSTYAAKLNVSQDEIEKLVAEETWYTAEEALSIGFADEIIGQSEIGIEDFSRMTTARVNMLQKNFSAKQFQKGGSSTMEQQSLLEKISALIGNKTDEVQKTRAAEVERIQALNALRTGAGTVNAIIDAAISSGDSAEKAKVYVDAVKNVSDTDATLAAITALIEDNLKSGAGNVTSEPQVEDKSQIQAEQAKLIASFANGTR